MTTNKIPVIKKDLGVIKTDEKVGFSFVPDQIRKKSIHEGFCLNILVLGRRGLGTSTLMNALFCSPLVDKNRSNEITTSKNEIFENEICLDVSITTYHGTDHNIALKFIENQNNEYFEKEQGFLRPIKDNRVHVCIYMVPSDRLADDEITFMKEVSLKTNFIPVISKADCFTQEELKCVKDRIKSTIEHANVLIYTPALSDEDDFEFVAETKTITNSFPLAVIASENVYEHNGQTIRGRKYLWGFVNIETEETSDFLKLRKLLINCHLDDLILKTDTFFYNSYREEIMKNEALSDSLRKNRLLKIRDEMERILKEKNQRKIEKLKYEEEKMERFYREKLNIQKKEHDNESVNDV